MNKVISPQRRVLTYGTFDLFHVGHVRLLKRIADLGDELIVGCSTDGFNELKGKKSIFPYEERAEILLSCKYVSQVIPEQSWEQKESDIETYGIDCFAMGDDWAGQFDYLEGITRVVYLPRTPGISTTHVKDVVGAVIEDKKKRLRNAAKLLNEVIDRM
ncbi:adenylyltransferase/cytidyltransferase family protein [Roseivivax marinus]|uniref:adenylyltransferase/cytidyltransferase family protein n=1 Tax=Roseivivax marinus TaxID=1379903 RepID=UPI00273D7511|nr:adenylyltransferase/cytidyltransferase family protein [Roseivivax marinus]